jgi:hypothetical protein
MLESRFATSHLAELRRIVGSSESTDPDFCWCYPLDTHQLSEIETVFGAPFALRDREVALVPWHSLREVPYLVHTGFELALMVESRKPFAKFSGIYPSEWLDEHLSVFAPFVESGQLVRREVKRPFEKPTRRSNGDIIEGVREVFFTLPGQEWRVEANRLLFETMSHGGWNDILERLEGSLLGYEQWQNDWWIDHRRKCRVQNELQEPDNQEPRN